MIYAAFRAWKTLRRYFISLPSKTAFYCVTKSREPTTNESDVFSVLACTLFVSVDDKLVSILPYHRKAKNKRSLSDNKDIILSTSRERQENSRGNPHQRKKVIRVKVKKFDVMIVPRFLKGGGDDAE